MKYLFLLLFLTGCSHFFKTHQYKVEPPVEVPAYNINLNCKKIGQHQLSWLSYNAFKGTARFSEGEFYLEKIEKFICPKDAHSILVAFSFEEFMKLRLYIKQLYESYEVCRK